MRWLERNTLAVLERVAKKEPFIADCAVKRAKRFECKTPRAIQRHIFLSDIPDVNLNEVRITIGY